MALKKYEAQLHTSCDYVLKNFEVRQEARSTLLELASVPFDTAENEPAKSLQILQNLPDPRGRGHLEGRENFEVCQEAYCDWILPKLIVQYSNSRS